MKGESFLTNAKYHEDQRWILSLDIKDFFPSISFARVRGLFLSKFFEFNDRVSTILARICTFQGGLPQGASTSPVLANILAYTLDSGLVGLAKRERAKYSRYADDITFSSSRHQIPLGLIRDYSRKYENGKITLGSDVVDVFARAGFQINERKTRLLLRSDRQEVTGLIVNERANVWRRDISRLRMKIHSANKFGSESAAKIWISEDATGQRFDDHVIGWLAFIRQVRGERDPVLAKLCKLAVEAKIANVKWIVKGAEMVREYDVFLSHASEDKEEMRKLYVAMVSRDIKVFFDEESIVWGDSIVEKINIGLLRSTYFMPYLTETFYEKGWTNRELNSAISMNASQKGRIIPVKGKGFSLDDRYPLLNDTIYTAWPSEESLENKFIEELADAVLAKIERDRHVAK